MLGEIQLNCLKLSLLHCNPESKCQLRAAEFFQEFTYQTDPGRDALGAMELLLLLTWKSEVRWKPARLPACPPRMLSGSSSPSTLALCTILHELWLAAPNQLTQRWSSRGTKPQFTGNPASQGPVVTGSAS